jgi:hypothetical protein
MKDKFYLLTIAVLLCLFGWTEHSKIQASNPAAQAWEYKSVTLTRTIQQPNFTWAEDGKELPGSPNMTLKGKELGEQGWELVTITPMSSQTGDGYTGFTNTLLYWFKRPK